MLVLNPLINNNICDYLFPKFIDKLKFMILINIIIY